MAGELSGIERESMVSYLQDQVYGQWRSGEEVSFEILSEEKVKIIVKNGNNVTSFGASFACPKEASDKHGEGFPFFICMHPIKDYEAAIEKGYACLFIDSLSVASDDTKHQGAFYDLYPYTDDLKSQTGVLMAWGWGASKVLDAVYNGLDKILNLKKDYSLVTGVSRWGKAVAVLGVFDKRFKMVIPACSGAGGLALYSVKSEGKTYDMTAVGGPKEYTYGQNEPLSCLQSDAERGWFVDAFLYFKTEEELPYDQDILPILAAGEDRGYYIVAAHMNEDWVNAPSMWECYLKARDYYEKNSLGDRIFANFHKEGHAVLREDFEVITEKFDELYFD
ncbi:MAG: hypothetical protein MJ123_06600 [Lachnospiraceae bacterium]|nr:hypothetical protein [Lachnospiraceae bacterium]